MERSRQRWVSEPLRGGSKHHDEQLPDSRFQAPTSVTKAKPTLRISVAKCEVPLEGSAMYSTVPAFGDLSHQLPKIAGRSYVRSVPIESVGADL